MSDSLSVQLQSNAPLTYTPILSPSLTSYQGMSGSELIGLANEQASYDPTPPIANQQQAMQYVQAAAQATDPGLAQQLLQQAIGMLQRGGSPQPISQPVSTPISAPVQTAPVASAPSAAPSLSVNGNSVNTGEYTITASTSDDGSLTITNNQTGQSTEVWGDPHIKVNGQDTADFQKDPLNIQLQDGTVIHIDPTPVNSNGVSHIGQVSITKGDDAVTMGGTGPNGFSGGVMTSGVLAGDAAYQSGLYNAPNATDITLGADGNLYYNNANGSMGQEITAQSNGSETDLDGAGGGLVGGPVASGATGVSSGGMQQTIDQLLGLLAQNQNSFYSIMMQQTLSNMMSQSGYAQA